MKKIYATKLNTPVVPLHRSFRRLVAKILASLLKHQNGFQATVLDKLQDIGDSIEIIAREMARQAKRSK